MSETSNRWSENDLLQQAAVVLRTRYERGNFYTELSETAASELEKTLIAVAAADDDLEGTDRDEAVALAHRIVDDDTPELSPMWPGESG